MSFDCTQKDVSNGNDDQTAPTLVPEEPTAEDILKNDENDQDDEMKNTQENAQKVIQENGQDILRKIWTTMIRFQARNATSPAARTKDKPSSKNKSASEQCCCTPL